MASNSASKNIYCSNSSNPYVLKVNWSESSPSIANNTSIISISASLGASNVSWDSYYNSYLKIYWHDDIDAKDVLVATSAAFTSCGMSYGTKSVSGSITVKHKDNGSLNGFAKVVFEAGSTSGGWSPSSNSVMTDYTALTVIARASSFTISSANKELGSAVSIAIDRKSDSFTHKVEYYFEGSDYTTVSTSATTSASFTPPISLCSRIPNSTTGTLSVRVTTFNGSSQIGSAVTNTINLSVPSSVVPTMNTPTATRVDNGVPSSWGVYVKGYSKVTIAASGAAGVYGSTIKSYSISGPGLSSTSSSATSAVLSESGTLTYKVTVTDSRGRTVTKSVSINVIDYSLPSINANAVRCSSDGTSNKNGTYLKVAVNWNIASVSSKNSVSSKSVSCNGVSKTDFSNGTAFVLAANCSIGSSYTLTASVTDALGNSASATVTISTSSRVMNVRKNKTGIAFGKFAETDYLFEVEWPMSVNSRSFHAIGITAKDVFYCGYDLRGSSGNAEWVKLGTYHNTWDATSALITVMSGNGFNAGSGQNTKIEIFVKDGWQSSASASRSFGVSYVVSHNENNGIRVKALASSHKSVDIWVYMPWSYWDGHYTVQCVGSWTHSGAHQTSEPSGTAQDVADKSLLNIMWPVGSVYITYNNNNPGNFLGGTWEQFGQGRTLIGQGTGNDGSTSMSFSANSTGGNYNHTHTYGLINSDWYGTIPGVGILNKDGTYKRGTKISTARNESVVTSATATKTGACTQYTMSAEVSETSTLPPYISVYFWRRTV